MSLTANLVGFGWVWTLLGALFIALMMYLASEANMQRFLHLLQLESYQLDGYGRSVKRNARMDVWPAWGCALVYAALCLGGFVLQAVLQAALYNLIVGALALCLFVAICLETGKRKKQQKQKKEYVRTDRMKRLERCTKMVLAAVSLICVLLGWAVIAMTIDSSVMVAALGCFVAAILSAFPVCMLPQWVVLAAMLRQRPEQKINRRFVEDAVRIIDSRDGLIRVGITGSYGKTSTKFVLGTILQEKYDVLVPPSSYNTPMGVTRVIREMLNNKHEVFICEMGARRCGEIKELCDIAKPKYGILTSIGNQHLETFGSIENIQKTKYELMQSLPADGKAFFPADGALCEDLYRQHTGPKCLFGLTEDCDVRAVNLDVGPFGSEFDLQIRGADSVHCTTQLLGKHNIMNVLGCAAAAYELGLTLEQIAAGIQKAEPVEHRLQLINPNNGTLVIDDAFNSNPNGTKAAMEVLSMYTQFRKICVTPGMVELGEKEEEENQAFGERMAAVCEFVILVGQTRAIPIKRGLLKAGFPEENIFVGDNLDQATEILGALIRPGDVVLFENDLPDHYEH